MGRGLIQQCDFGADVEECRRLERVHRADRCYDTVLFDSDSIESVQATHASHFCSGAESVEQYLRSVLEDNCVTVNRPAGARPIQPIWAGELFYRRRRVNGCPGLASQRALGCRLCPRCHDLVVIR